MRHYQEALAIQREVGNRSKEGSFLGHLGNLHAQQGRIDEAREALVAGEALLRLLKERLGLATLLCQRGGCERLAGDLPAARACFAEAEGLARELATGPDSELGKMIAKLRADLDGAADVPHECAPVADLRYAAVHDLDHPRPAPHRRRGQHEAVRVTRRRGDGAGLGLA